MSSEESGQESNVPKNVVNDSGNSPGRDESDFQKDILAEYGIADISEIDKIELSILIIAKDKDQLESAASFLSRRGWSTTVTSSMAEAINRVVADKPKFVLVSANHPNPKIARLPSILGQAFNTKCVGFAEKSDGVSQGLLNGMKTSLKFFGQLSGPSIHRQIKKLILDEFNAAKEKSTRTYESNTSMGDDSIRVAGESGGEAIYTQHGGGPALSEKGPGVVKGSVPTDTASLLKMLTDDESSDEEPIKLPETNSDALVYEGSGAGNRRSMKVKKQSKQKSDSHSDSVLSKETASNEGNTSRTGTIETKEVSTSDNQNGKKTHSAEQSNIEARAIGGSAIEAKKEGQQGINEVFRDSDKEQNTEFNESDANSNSKKHLDSKLNLIKSKDIATPASEIHPLEQRKDREHEVENVLLNEELSNLAKAVKKGLMDVCHENNAQTKYLFGVETLGVIPFHSSQRKGYLTVAWADQSIEEHRPFLEALRFSIMNFMAMEGVQASLDPEFIVHHLPKVNFIKWAKTSEFLILREHLGVEVGVSFFTGHQIQVSRPQIVDKMLKVGVDTLSPEKSVSFRAYLKLELNKKFVTYLSEGGKISMAQKKRLLSRSVDSLYIRPEDLAKFQRYLQEIEMLDLISHFASTTQES